METMKNEEELKDKAVMTCEQEYVGLHEFDDTLEGKTTEEKYTLFKKYFEKKLLNVIAGITNTEGVYELYPDYSYQYDDHTLAQMYENVSENGFVDEMMYYDDSIDIENLYEYLHDEMKDIYPYYDEFIELNEFVPDIPIESGFYKCLEQSTCNIVVTLGGGDDYTAQENYITDDRGEGIDESIFSFLQSQGVSRKQLYTYVRRRQEGLTHGRRDEFLESIMREIDNSYGYSELTFLLRVDGKQLLAIAEGRYKSLTIATDTMCGLVDFTNGGGSILELRLQNPVTIPIDTLHIQPDIAYQYGVQSIYGLISSVWDNASEWHTDTEKVNPEFK